MPFSYNPSELATNEVYQVRAELQDTDPKDQQLQDEEIAYALTQERNFWAGCARCAEMIGRRILRQADVRLGRSMQVQYTKMAEQYFNMARMLRSKAMGTVAPYVGGMLAADKLTIGQDSGLVAPMFTKTMMENPWTGGYTTDSLPPTTGDEGIDFVTDEVGF
jgi:hypothetical protein